MGVGTGDTVLYKGRRVGGDREDSHDSCIVVRSGLELGRSTKEEH